MSQFEEVKALMENSMSYYLIAVDMNSNYSFINKRYSSIFEPIHGNLVGKHYAVTMHQDDLQICEYVAQQAFNQPDQLFPAMLRKHDGNGGYIITRWEYKAMFDEKMNPIGIFCIGHDITELLEVSTELENAKLFQSHSLRKPVANLLGLSRLMEKCNMSNECKILFNLIKQSVQELDEVMRQGK